MRPRTLLRATLVFAAACAEGASAAHHEEPAASEPESCDRACLIETAKSVLEDPAGARAHDARLTENGKITMLQDSWLMRASDWHVHNAYADASRQQVMLVGNAHESASGDALFGVRMQLQQKRATEVEVLITHEGEAGLFPMQLPVATDDRYAQAVPKADRDSGQTMLALANRYFDGIEASGDKGLPVGDDCNRVENGVQTTRNPRFGDLRCNTLEPFVYIPVVEQRRFPIVDDERGVAAAIVVFQIPGGDYELELNGEKVMRSYTPRALYLFEAFKVAGGRIQQIEATMRNLEFEAHIDWPSD